MQSDIVIFAMLVLLVLLAVWLVAGKRLAAFFVRTAGGGILMLVINFLISPTGLFVGINLVTLLVAGLLGIPGIAALYALAHILN